MTASTDDPHALIDHVYDVAIAPERIEQLVDSWMARFASLPHDAPILADATMFPHVQRAERILRELIAVSGEARDSVRDWIEAARAAAIVVNRSGIVIAANDTARQMLAIEPGNTLSVLPVVPDDLAVLTDLIERLDGAGSSGQRLLRLRQKGETAPMLVSVVEAIGGDPDHTGLITSILSWPEKLSQQLAATFQLTSAEAAVLKDLTLGFSVKDITERSERSEATVRSHVKALLGKTGARSQTELVRVTLGLLDIAEQPPHIAPLRGPPGVSPEPNHYNTLILADGRRLDYLKIGDPQGRPFLMLPTDVGFTRLPPPAERWLADNNLAMIVPVRAGYGNSSPLPPRRDAYETAISDMRELAGHHRIDRCPILAFCDDFHLAVSTAVAAPKFITAIIGVGAAMPVSEPKHFQRMPKMTRFVYATAHYAPRALPYVAMLMLQSVRRLGPRRFLQMAMASSKADHEILANDELMTAMLRGTEITVGPRFTAHAALAAGALSSYGTDWKNKLAKCPVPMILFSGHQDPFSPFETVKEYAAITPSITLHDFPEYGQFLYPVWPQFLRDVERFVGN